MSAIGTAIAVAGGILGLLFIYLILMPFLCGVGSWVIGLIFGDLILRFLSGFGIHGYTMFQLGVVFGYLGSFVKAYQSNTNK